MQSSETLNQAPNNAPNGAAIEAPQAPRCKHVRTNGTRCGSPALKDYEHCYYHQQCRTVTFNYRGMYKDYTACEFHLPAFEDMHSVQFTLRAVTELILRHKIDLKEAALLLYALQIASCNIGRLGRDEPPAEQVVRDVEIEHVLETPEEAAEFGELQDEEITRIYGDGEEPAPRRKAPY